MIEYLANPQEALITIESLKNNEPLSDVNQLRNATLWIGAHFCYNSNLDYLQYENMLNNMLQRLEQSHDISEDYFRETGDLIVFFYNWAHSSMTLNGLFLDNPLHYAVYTRQDNIIDLCYRHNYFIQEYDNLVGLASFAMKCGYEAHVIYNMPNVTVSYNTLIEHLISLPGFFDEKHTVYDLLCTSIEYRNYYIYQRLIDLIDSSFTALHQGLPNHSQYRILHLTTKLYSHGWLNYCENRKYNDNIIETTHDSAIKVFQELIKYGININAQNDYRGTTILMDTVEKRQYYLFYLLITLGADPNVRRFDGKNSYDIARGAASFDVETLNIICPYLQKITKTYHKNINGTVLTIPSFHYWLHKTKRLKKFLLSNFC